MNTHSDFCTSEDFDYEIIRRSYNGISFVPEKRAGDEITARVEWLNAEAAKFYGMCSNDDQRAYLAEQLPIFKARYLEHCRRLTAARGNCVSTMIAGPSNFPVRRAEKANATERRRYEEYEVWLKKARAAIAKGIAARKTAEQVDQESMGAVKSMIMRSYLNEQWGRQNCYGRFETWAKHNTPEMVQAALEFLREWQNKRFGGKGFTPRHKIWALTGMMPQEPKETTSETVNGVEIFRNADIDRVQLFFSGKPAADTINALKRHGWRWSPKNGAWQRQNTDNALASAREIVVA